MSEETRVTRFRLKPDQVNLWDQWGKRLREARHPSLARVLDLFQGDGWGEVHVEDPDSEGIRAWVERTGAPVPERLAVLGAVASALDALHIGTDTTPGIAHGSLDLESIRVGSSGAARLVGFAPWTPDAIEPRFLAPEVVPGGPASVAGDAYAYVRIVAEVLGGNEVSRAQTVDEVVKALRSGPETRRRARLIRAVQLVLSSPPEARPSYLTRWLAEAVEGTALTTRQGMVTLARDAREDAPLERSRRWLPATALAVALAAGAGIWVGFSHGSAARTLNEPVGPIVLTGRWAEACEGVELAHRDPNLPALHRSTTAAKLARAIDANEGGRWHTGRYLVTLRATSLDERIAVGSVTPDLPPAAEPAPMGRNGDRFVPRPDESGHRLRLRPGLRRAPPTTA